MSADPTHTFGTGASLLGLSLEDWVLVNQPSNTSKDDAVVRDATGEFLPDSAKAFNEKNEVSEEYECAILGAAGELDIVSEAGAFAITQIKVSTQEGRAARLTVTGHQHIGGTSANHVANPRTITLPAFDGFGATDLTGSAIASTDVQTSDWTATLDHVDKQNNLGDFLCGRSQGCTIEATVEAVTETKPVIPTDPAWTKWEADIRKSNSDFYTVSGRGKLYLPVYTAPGP